MSRTPPQRSGWSESLHWPLQPRRDRKPRRGVERSRTALLPRRTRLARSRIRALPITLLRARVSVSPNSPPYPYVKSIVHRFSDWALVERLHRCSAFPALKLGVFAVG